MFNLPGPTLTPLTPNTSSADSGAQVSGGASGITTGGISVVGVAQSGSSSGDLASLVPLGLLAWFLLRKKKG